MFSLTLLGPAELRARPGPPSKRGAVRHRIAFLAVLAASGRRAVPRARLAALLYPGAPPDEAREGVARLVGSLRRSLGPEAIRTEGEEVWLDRARVTVDLHAFEDAVEAGDHARAALLYRGPFLDGFSLDTPAFDAWAAAERARIEGLLAPASSASPPASSSAPVAEARPASRWRWPAAAGALAMVFALGAFVWWSVGGAGGVDDDLLVAFPLRPVQVPDDSVLTPEGLDLRLAETLNGWPDVRRVDRITTRDALGDAPDGVPTSLERAREAARAVGAGRLLWGDYGVLGDTFLVNLGLYDTRRGHTLALERVRLPRDLADADVRLDRAVAALLRLDERRADRAMTNTTSVAAWRAFLRGEEALAAWDMSRAAEEFAAAVDADPRFAAAHLWLAQSLQRGALSVSAKRRAAALTAASSPAGLTARERNLAEALVAMDTGAHPAACDRYRALLKRDPFDPDARFGLAECHTQDPVVVRDPASPSGWRFRGSVEQGSEAYEAAFAAMPPATAMSNGGFRRLIYMLKAEPRHLRRGRAVEGGDTIRFGAYLSLESDTLVAIPWPVDDISQLRPRVVPATRHDAAMRNRARLHAVAGGWVFSSPRSADAHEALALALELQGEFVKQRQNDTSAMDALARARALSGGGERTLRLRVAEVRVLLKAGRYEDARARADSLLSEWDAPGPHEAQYLAPLAVLTGRLALALDLMGESAMEQRFSYRAEVVTTPKPVARSTMFFWAAAMLGLTSLADAREAEVEYAIAGWAKPEDVEAMRTAVLGPGRIFRPVDAPSLAAIDTEWDPNFVLLEMARRGDTAAAWAQLARLEALHEDRRPGDLTMSRSLVRARVRAALGDTAGARDELDGMLRGVAVQSSDWLARPEDAGALVQGLLLAGELAAAQGDRAEAVRLRWRLNVLWRGADPEVRALLAPPDPTRGISARARARPRPSGAGGTRPAAARPPPPGR